MLLSSQAAVAAMTMMMTTVVVVVRVRAGLWLFRTGIIYPGLYVRRQGIWKNNLSNMQYLVAASLVECMFVWVGCGYGSGSDVVRYGCDASFVFVFTHLRQ